MSETVAGRILEDLERSGIRLGLRTVRAVLAARGEPQRAYRSVLVAGTNGKGSTASLLAAMATAAGYRTGLYTSPHLEHVCERIRVDGIAVGEEELGAELSEIVELARRETGSAPTHFEALTAAALGLFRDHGVELALLEVGLGGRLDATNVVDPVLSVITDIGLDHREYLGDSIPEIAREKAGILRRGGVAVTAGGAGEATEEIVSVARELRADLHAVSEEVEIVSVEPVGREEQSVALATPEATYELRTRLLGEHQARNLAHAVRGAELLRAAGWEKLDQRAIAAGASQCRWPGRLEWVRLPDGRAVLLDVGHNRAAAAALATFLEARGLDYDLLFGALADKEPETFLPELARRAARVVLTAPPSTRAARPEGLALTLPRPDVVLEPGVEAALKRALDLRRAEILLVCGSVFLVGAVRAELRRRFGVPSAAAGPLFPAPA